MTMTTESVDVPERLPHRLDAYERDVDAVVDIVVPVYNEELDLEPSVRRLDAYLAQYFPYAYRITIADNASTDTTWQVATALAEELGRVPQSLADGERRPERGWQGGGGGRSGVLRTTTATQPGAFWASRSRPGVAGHALGRCDTQWSEVVRRQGCTGPAEGGRQRRHRTPAPLVDQAGPVQVVK